MLALSLFGCGKSKPKESSPAAAKKAEKISELDKPTKLAIGKATAKRLNPETKKVIWEIEWENSDLKLEDGSQFGQMHKVKGYFIGKAGDKMLFSGDEAISTKGSDDVTIKGNVALASESGDRKLSADQLKYLAQPTKYLAVGNVKLKTKEAEASGDKMLATSDLSEFTTRVKL